MTLAVSIRNLAMQYGRRLVFQELSFDLAAGQAAGVVGARSSVWSARTAPARRRSCAQSRAVWPRDRERFASTD